MPLWIEKQPISGHFPAHRRDAIRPFLQILIVPLTEHHFAKMMRAPTNSLTRRKMKK
jgi:hypothetical protein